MNWVLSSRCDKQARPLADRHYNRQSVGAKFFTPPGRCLVLITPEKDALWVTSWPFAEYVMHEWAGAWICSCFRNESSHTASLLNREAVAVTRWVYGDPPQVQSSIGPVGFVSFIDRDKVKPTMRRGKPTWGYSYFKAGWEYIGETKGGLMAVGLRPSNMPEPQPCGGHLFSSLVE